MDVAETVSTAGGWAGRTIEVNWGLSCVWLTSAQAALVRRALVEFAKSASAGEAEEALSVVGRIDARVGR